MCSLWTCNYGWVCRWVSWYTCTSQRIASRGQFWPHALLCWGLSHFCHTAFSIEAGLQASDQFSGLDLSSSGRSLGNRSLPLYLAFYTGWNSSCQACNPSPSTYCAISLTLTLLSRPLPLTLVWTCHGWHEPLVVKVLLLWIFSEQTHNSLCRY